MLKLLFDLLPLYTLVLLGYIAGKYLHVSSEPISKLLIFVINPPVIFYTIVNSKITSSYFIIPVAFFVISIINSLVFFRIGKRFWKGPEKNLLSSMSGSSNTGYFGLPLCFTIAGQKGLNVAIFVVMGGILYEKLRMFYISVRSKFSIKEAIRQTLLLPAVYAFILGMFVKMLDIKITGTLLDTFDYLRGAYIVLGMMIIGLVLAKAQIKHIDLKLISLSLVAKFITFPATTALLVLLDREFLHILNPFIHKIFLIISTTPIAVSTVLYATYLDIKPEKVAVSVAISTIVAVLYIPIFIATFLN